MYIINRQTQYDPQFLPEDRVSPDTQRSPQRWMTCRTPIYPSHSRPCWMASNVCQSTSLYAEAKAANHWKRTIILQIKKNQLVKEVHGRSRSLTSSPAMTSIMTSNDREKQIWTISSPKNRSILSSITRECSLSISQAQRKYPKTVPSCVLSDIQHVKIILSLKKELKHKRM